MPEVRPVKELYMATSIDNLRNRASLPKGAVQKLGKSYQNTYSKAKRLLDEGILKEKEGDEEQAFFYFYRSCEIAGMFPKCSDRSSQSKDVLKRGLDLFSNVLKRLDDVQNSLIRRYKFRRGAEEVEAKESCDLPASGDHDLEIKNKSGLESDFADRREINPEELYHLVNRNDSPKVMVFDLRPEPHSAVSIKSDNFDCVFVSPSLLNSGCTAKRLGESLPVSERGIFMKRHQMDYVILMDKRGSAESLSVGKSPTRTLFNAITQYDQSGTLKHPPLVLRGGFVNWQLHYQMLVSKLDEDEEDNCETNSIYTDITCDLSQVFYPDLDEYFAQKPQIPQGTISASKESVERISLPKVDSDRTDFEHRRLPPTIPDRGLKPRFANSSSGVQPSDSDNSFLPENDHNLDQPNNNNSSSSTDQCTGGSVAEVEIAEEPKNKPLIDRSKKPAPSEVESAVLNDPSKSSSETFSDDVQEHLNGAVSHHIDSREQLNLLEQQLKECKISEEDRSEDGASNEEPAAQSERSNNAHNIPSDEAEPVSETKVVGSTSDIGNVSKDDNFINEKGTVQESKNETVPPNFILRPKIPDRSTKPDLHSQMVDDKKEFQHQIMLLRRDAIVGRTESGLTGLFNLGNTCYMNSVIQCLSNSLDLAEYFLRRTYVGFLNRGNWKGSKGKLATSFAALIYELHSCKYRALRPTAFRDTVYHVLRYFRDKKQHDAEEFLLYLIDCLHEDLNHVRKRVFVPEQNNSGRDLVREGNIAWMNLHSSSKSHINELFEGQFLSTLKCTVCETRSPTFESFTQIHLELPTGMQCFSLNDCLQRHVRAEMLDWTCSNCNSKRDSIKKIDFCRLPKYLIVHLKRFETTHCGAVVRKIETYVDFPVRNFSMDHFLHPSFVNSKDYFPREYQLYAVANHIGEHRSGHYTASVFNPGLKRWFLYDDEVVSPMHESRVVTDKAYILFYVSA